MASYYAGEDVVIGFEQPSYTVGEGDGTVTVCTRVLSGTIGNRTFTVDYETVNDVAMGKISQNYFTWQEVTFLHEFSLPS